MEPTSPKSKKAKKEKWQDRLDREDYEILEKIITFGNVMNLHGWSRTKPTSPAPRPLKRAM